MGESKGWRGRMEQTVQIQITPLVNPGGFGYFLVLSELDIKVVPISLPLHQIQDSFLVRKEVGYSSGMSFTIDGSKFGKSLIPLILSQVTSFGIFYKHGGRLIFKGQDIF